MAAPTASSPTTTSESLVVSDRPPEDPDLGFTVVVGMAPPRAGVATVEGGRAKVVVVASVVDGAAVVDGETR